jgi:hypothetical protein
MKASICCLALVLSTSAWAVEPSSDCPAAVKIGLIDYNLPPLLVGDPKSSDPQGRLAEWIHAVLDQGACRPRLSFVRMPLRRGRSAVSSGDIDIWGAAQRSQELLEHSVLPVAHDDADASQLGYFRLNYFFYVGLDEREISWDGKQLTGPPGMAVGISPVQPLDELAARHGWRVDRALDSPNALQKLLTGRDRVIILSDAAMRGQPKDILDRVRQLKPSPYQGWLYSAANKDFAARHPVFLNNYWYELCRVARAEQPELPACRKP